MTISKFFEIFEDVELKIWNDDPSNVYISAVLYEPIYVGADAVCSKHEIECGIDV